MRLTVPGRGTPPWLAYLLLGLLAVGFLPLLPYATRNGAYAALGGSAVVAILLGVRLHRPAHRRPWLLLALGDGLAVSGDVIRAYHEHAHGIANPPPPLADALYLGGYGVFCLGVLLLIRSHAGGYTSAALIDTAIIASGVGLVVGVFLIGPHLAAPDRPLLDQLIASAYPLIDLLILAAAVRLAFGFKRLTISLSLLILALAIGFGTDIAYTILAARGQHQTGHPIGAGWLLAFILHGVIALHPSMRRAPEPLDPGNDLPAGRLPLLATAAIVGPATVAIQTARGEPLNVMAVVAISAVLFLLALGRLRLLTNELRGHEARFRALVQHGADGVGIVDAAGITRYSSPATSTIIGIAPEEMIGTNAFAHIHPDDQATAHTIFAELLASPGATRMCTLRVQHADGAWRRLEVRGTNLLAEPGVDGIVINYRDITARARAEALLAGQADILERIAQDAPLAATLEALARQVEALGTGALVSVRLLEEGGTTLRCVAAAGLPADFAAATVRIPVGEGGGACGTAAARGRAVITADIATDPLWDDYRDFALAQGLRACWSLPILPLGIGGPDAAGRPLGTFAVYYTAPCQPGEAEWQALGRSVGLAALAIERDRAAATLRDSERDYRVLLEQAADAILIFDGSGRFVRVNAQACALTGYSRAELLTRTIADITPPAERAAIAARLASLGIETRTTERLLRRKDGGILSTESSAVRLEDGRVQIIIRDITARREVEAARRAAERRYRALVEQIPAMTYIADYDEVGRTTYISPQVEPLLGYTPEEYLADPRKWVTALHPEDRARVLASMADARARGGSAGLEYRLLARDGRTVWVRDEIAILRDEDDRPIALQGLLLDITARQAAEVALRESAESFESLLQNTAEGIVITEEGRIVAINRAYSELLGYELSDVLEIEARDLVVPDDRATVAAHIRDGYEQPYEVAHRRKDGSTLVTELIGRAFRYGGRPARLTTVRDITARKAAEAALRERDERFRLVARATNDAIWDWDLTTDDLWWNEAIRVILGYEPGRIGPRIDWWEAHVHPDDQARVVGGLRAAITGGAEHWSAEYRLRRAGGSDAIVLDRGFVLRDEAGRAIRMLGSMQDITARKRAEEEARRRARELALLDRVRTTLASELDLDTILDALVTAVAATFNTMIVEVALVEGDQLVGQAHTIPGRRRLTLPLTAGVMGRCAGISQPILIPDVRLDTAFVGDPAWEGSEICVPLVVGARPSASSTSSDRAIRPSMGPISPSSRPSASRRRSPSGAPASTRRSPRARRATARLSIPPSTPSSP